MRGLDLAANVEKLVKGWCRSTVRWQRCRICRQPPKRACRIRAQGWNGLFARRDAVRDIDKTERGGAHRGGKRRVKNGFLICRRLSPDANEHTPDVLQQLVSATSRNTRSSLDDKK